MKKKHLSRNVLERILMILAGLFLFLMVITMIAVCLYAGNRTDIFLSAGLEGLKDDAVYKNNDNLLYVTEQVAEYTENILESKGTEFLMSREYMSDIKSFVDIDPVSEVNIVDPKGIIIASTIPENLGFDMHSDPKMSEFLCLLDGKTKNYSQDPAISPINGIMMKYVGVPMPEYGGFTLEGQTGEENRFELEKHNSYQIRYEETGSTGYYLQLNKEGKIISSTKDIYTGKTFTLSDDIMKAAESGRSFKADVFGVTSYVSVTESAGDYILAVYPFSEAWETWNAAMAALLMIYAVVFLLLFFLINRLMKKHVVAGVYSLSASLDRITGGDLEERADYRDSVEFDELSDGINFTVDWLKKLIKEAKERIDRELALAAKIQTSFLPHNEPPFPERDEFELYAAMVPAKEVGGDFYDYFLIDDDHLALVMADVSGKGIPAAMFMVMAKDKIHHSAMKYCTDVAAAVTEVNLALMKESDSGLFVTVWLGVVTLSTGHVDYVDAGHEYPAICRDGGRFRVVRDEHNGPVAALGKMKFDAGALDLKPGDTLFLYTDGVTEANDAGGEMFGAGKMLDALNTDTHSPVEEIDANVRRAIESFIKEAPQFDDITTLVFRYKEGSLGSQESLGGVIGDGSH